MKDLEFRSIEEVRAVEDSEKMIIEGVVNNIGEWSKPIAGLFRERIMPGVFKNAITRTLEKGDIFFLHQHDTRNLPLASMKSETLELVEEDNKLKMRAILPETTLSKDIYSLVKSGVLREFSFGFNNPKSEWKTGKDGLKERSITDLNLFEISIVRIGAYNQTEAYARAFEEIEEEKEARNSEEAEKIKNIENRLKIAKLRTI